MAIESQLSEDTVTAALNFRDYRTLRLLFKEHDIADIAEVFSCFEISSCIVLFRLVPRNRRAGLFSYMSFDLQEGMLDELPDVIASALLNEMEADDRTGLLEDLSDEVRNRVLLLLNPQQQEIARRLLSYPEGSVGRLMTPDFVALRSDMTVAQALDHLHWSTTLPTDYLNYLFVVDDDGAFVGGVGLANLVVCDPRSMPISTIIKTHQVTLQPDADGVDAVEIFRKYDVHFIPVLDEQRSLIGIVTSDDVFEFAEEEATEDIQQFGGHAALDHEYFQTPFWTMFEKRAFWLAFLFIGAFISGEAIRSSEGLLEQWPFLVFFLTTITSAGGNSGTQTASLIIRAMAINEIAPKDVWKVLRREVAVGLALGLMLAALGAGRAVLWGLGVKVALVIGGVVTLVVLAGVCAGSMLPFLFRLVRLDPAVVSSPFISTIMDLTGVWLLFSLAKLMMFYFGFP
ncbi:MAG: magnesium transporter [Zetaproteobacteria bacterium]|nr:magnesium transporter [Zetaproteobacteria bacterium]